MSKRIRTLAILAVAAMTIMGANGDVITIPENGTFQAVRGGARFRGAHRAKHDHQPAL